MRSEIDDLTRLMGGLAVDEDGPLWYRGLAEGSQAELLPHVEALLRRTGSATS